MQDKNEEKLAQLRAEIQAFVHERSTLKDSLRRVQGALRQEARLQQNEKQPNVPEQPKETADTECLNKPASDTVVPESESPSRKRARETEGSETEKDGEDQATESAAQPTEPPVVKRPRLELDDSAKQRTAKLFGHLMGHLKKAKERLDSDRDTKAAELQLETARRVREKLEREKTALAAARVQSLKETEASLKEKLRRVQWELSSRETLCLRYQLELHYTIMQAFIKTTAEPTLFWVPRVHNDQTRSLQQETAAQIEKKNTVAPRATTNCAV
eukprot:Gregarina_sp_Poly_1__2809@NODE_1781_length_3339_cov_73_424817_g1159_i0_p2_GENE_NODE_1781_length_3339_cov_73_424817_g1159_i0NODE_1781_length_3339_cov_73_424817_g1159_i0_p2_ORF_typecomplete_len280_score49_59Pinin_SDK_memA/PF04696_13/1_8e04Pinin_SDK_memA/PF04696_13/9_2e17DUF1387/PF07139_11/0_07DUF1387/PF07139_11/1_8e04GIT_CC/PF16559_5/16GIT_CC/PF16559_5/0_8RseA_N/PF03872_13/77RseA_N/PF03872_13/2_5LCD1/PF09798_9/3_3Syntaxin6_N/PF09177_11/81Syntaxin6_N/PF09177_11/4_5TMEM108/PF15759_5/15CCDC106/PF1579